MKKGVDVCAHARSPAGVCINEPWRHMYEQTGESKACGVDAPKVL